MKKRSKIEELFIQLALELNLQDEPDSLPDVMEVQIGGIKGAYVYGELYFYSNDIDGNFHLVKGKDYFEELERMLESSRNVTYYVVGRYQSDDTY